MNKNILIILSILLVFHFCKATTYYVSKDTTTIGYNTTGLSRATAFNKIQTGVNALKLGDSLIILKGTYNEKVKVLNVSGIAGDPIVILGDGKFGEWDVIISGLNLTDVLTNQGLFTIADQDFITVKNIKLVDSPFFGFSILNNVRKNPDNITIDSCSTLNTIASGIRAKNCSNIFIKHNIIEKACNYTGSSFDIHECISLSVVDTFEISNNEVKNGALSMKGGEGIDAKSGCKNGKITNNYVHDLPNDHGIYVDAHNLVSENIEVTGNIVTNCTQGIVLACEQEGTLDSIEISNNLVYKNKGDGIIISKYGKKKSSWIKKFSNINIVNNTCFKNGGLVAGKTYKWGYGIIINDSIKLENIRIKNNICSENAIGGIRNQNESMKAKISITRNLVHFLSGNEQIDTLLGSGAIQADPLFYNVASLNFSLAQNSPAINAGEAVTSPEKDILGNPRSIGGAVDLGAYERINIAPTVSFTKPLSDTTIFAPESITISANAIDSDGTITNVSFYNGSTLLGSTNVSPYSFTLVNPTEGQYTFVAKATDGSGAVATSSPLLIDYKKVYVNGLLGNYYNNVKNWTNNLALTRVDQQINFSWENDSPAAGVSADNFSVKWTGKIQAAKTETYTFYTYSDDGAYLKINGVVLIDKLVNQLRTSHSGSIALVAGTKYDIELRYYEAMGQAICKFQWSSPTTAKQIVPSAALFSEPIVNSRVGMPITEMSFLDNETTSIYPNPTTGFVHIFSWKDGDKAVVLDTKGNQMLQNTTNSSFWMGDLPNGIYILMHQGKAHKIIKE